MAPLETLTITLTNPRQIDGWVKAANRNGYTPEALATEFLVQQGHRYADDFALGVVTSAAFIRRFTAKEYGAIVAAAEQSSDVADLVDQLTASSQVVLDDSRLAPGLDLLVSLDLLDASRPAQILAYTRPEVD